MKRRLAARLAARLAVVAGAATMLLAPVVPASADGGASPAAPGVLDVRTVPATPGVRVAAEGRIAVADSKGIAHLPVQNPAELDQRFHVLDTRVSDARKVTVDRVVGDPSRAVRHGPLTVGLRTLLLVHWRFVDRGGREVPTDRVSLLELRSNTGEVLRFTGAQLSRPRWVAAGRTQQTPRGLVNKQQYWSVSRVVVDGADVVNRSQQVFVPEETQDWAITVLFYRVRVVGRDLLFGSLAGDGLAIQRPDGTTRKVPFVDGMATIGSLPRGTYSVHIYGPGASFTRPISISKDQLVEVEVISPMDLSLIAAVLVLVALSLIVVGRRHHLARLVSTVRARWRPAAGSVTTVVAAVLALGVGLGVAVQPPARAGTVSPGPDAPAFAYYYIWYQPTTWQRAKKDYPLLGRYSSDDPVVMRRHVMMAKAAGLTGFLVSWKGTSDLDSRLASLVRTARAQDFKLEIVYQGLDFERNPLPVAQVAADLSHLADQYAGDPVFDTFGKPVVVLTGSEHFSVSQLRSITRQVRGRLLLLASAKSVADYRRTASVVDGDAYYWSAIDPRLPLFEHKSRQMADAVHADHGLWFAPAPAGFDARLIGGKEVIPKDDGGTLRAAISAARRSSPDAVAVISWNEFSENSHVEPSQESGDTELAALAASLGGRSVVPAGLAPTDMTKRNTGLTGWGALLALLFLAAVANLVVALRRRSEARPPDDTDDRRGESRAVTVPAGPPRHPERSSHASP